MKVRNILIFPAGTEIGLEIFNALKFCKETRLFGGGEQVSNHAQMLYSTYHVIPSVHTSGWVERLAEVCRENKIDYVFPAHDDAIVALSQNRAKIPAVVLCPPEAVCLLTRSKSATYSALSETLRVPKLYRLDSAPESLPYPLLVKPDKGQGSLGVAKVDTAQQLRHAVQGISEPIISEYLPGEEFTIDCFSDRKTGLLFARARSRRRTRNGISMNTVTENVPEVRELANLIQSKLGMYGAWFFQLKRAEDGALALLEVAPRIAGAMATHRVMGVNFPLLTIFESERLPIKILPNEGGIELDRALCNRYRHTVDYENLYVDLDDTILCNGTVNTDLIALIFQSLAKGKFVALITRHRGDVTSTLKRFRISELFDQVIHLRDQEPKSNYIKPKSILIDDSFSERMEVSKKLHIPTFDCSMIEMLLETEGSMRWTDSN